MCTAGERKIALALHPEYLAALCLSSILCVNHTPTKIVWICPRSNRLIARLEAIMLKNLPNILF